MSLPDLDSIMPVKRRRRVGATMRTPKEIARDLAAFEHGELTGRCARCDWSETGTGPRVSAAFQAHRERCGVG